MGATPGSPASALSSGQSGQPLVTASVQAGSSGAGSRRSMGTRIGLVWIGRLDPPRAVAPINLSKLAAKFNSAQGASRAFDFSGSSDGIIIRDPLPTHAYPDSLYFDRLVERRNTGTASYLIGVSADLLDQSRFNVHAVDRGVGLVTMKDMEEYRPRGMTVGQYLYYLVLCEAFCIVGRRDFETDSKPGCLFDKCTLKEQLTQCLEKPQITDQSKEELIAAGFTEEHLQAATKALKGYVGRRPIIGRLPVSPLLYGSGIATGVFVHSLVLAIGHKDKAFLPVAGIAMVASIILFIVLRVHPSRGGWNESH